MSVASNMWQMQAVQSRPMPHLSEMLGHLVCFVVFMAQVYNVDYVVHELRMQLYQPLVPWHCWLKCIQCVKIPSQSQHICVAR